MTREYILLNLEGACPIWFMDEPALRDEVMKTLQDSLLIPKPKFKVGDVVKCKDGSYWDIDVCLYNLCKHEWFYSATLFQRKFYESELELVEAAK